MSTDEHEWLAGTPQYLPAHALREAKPQATRTRPLA